MEAKAIFEYLRSNVRLVGNVTQEGGNYGTEHHSITIELWATDPETGKDECVAREYLNL
jgi:hypothetical protein